MAPVTVLSDILTVFMWCWSWKKLIKLLWTSASKTGCYPSFESIKSAFVNNGPLKSSVGQIYSLHMVLVLKETVRTAMNICNSRRTGCYRSFESTNSVFDNNCTCNCSVGQIDSLPMVLVLKTTLETAVDICNRSRKRRLPYFESKDSVFDSNGTLNCSIWQIEQSLFDSDTESNFQNSNGKSGVCIIKLVTAVINSIV